MSDFGLRMAENEQGSRGEGGESRESRKTVRLPSVGQGSPLRYDPDRSGSSLRYDKQ